MNRLLAFFIALLFRAAASAAPASEASLEALLKITRAESMTDAMSANVDQMMRRTMGEMLKGETLSPAQQGVVDAMLARWATVMKEELGWARLRSIYIDIYADTFTQEEVDGLLAFYATPTGQALIAKMPVVMQKSMAITQSRLVPLVEKMKAAMDEAAAEAKRRP